MDLTSSFTGLNPNQTAPRPIYVPGDVDVGNRVISVDGLFVDRLGSTTTSANHLAIPTNGDSCHITGTTQINLISSVGWRGGARITLIFDSTPTVKDGQTVSGDFKPILLNGTTDFVATTNSTLSLIYDSTNSKWLECGRSKR